MEKLDRKDADAKNEHKFILDKVEAPTAKARGEGIRTIYRGIHENKDAFEKATKAAKDRGEDRHGDYFKKKD